MCSYYFQKISNKSRCVLIKGGVLIINTMVARTPLVLQQSEQSLLGSRDRGNFGGLGVQNPSKIAISSVFGAKKAQNFPPAAGSTGQLLLNPPLRFEPANS